jgi:hypothetical protein
MFAPYLANIGLAFSNPSALPPHIIASLASRAPISPPLTGASILSIPRSLAAFAIYTANYGDEVV